jgi:hypothetical protein
MIRCRLLVVVGMASAALIGGPDGSIGAQEATPTVACDVEPRSSDEMQSLGGTPSALTPSPTALTELPVGAPVDAATVAALEETLRLARACAEAGDLLRLLALYTDAYIAVEVAPAEAVPIVPGQSPEGRPTFPAGSPTPAAAPTVARTGSLPDGRIAARVVTGDRAEIVFFQYDEERQVWQIDAIQAITTGPATPTWSADRPAAVDAALADAASQLGVEAAELDVVTVEAREWPDASLGCPQPGEFYAQVVTPGYLIVVEASGESLEYHGDENGNVVLCEGESD